MEASDKDMMMKAMVRADLFSNIQGLGGSTYCAIAALALSNRLWDYSVYSEKEIRKLIKWAVYKQDEGMHGRAHKEDDCCYAFWIGATLNASFFL